MKKSLAMLFVVIISAFLITACGEKESTSAEEQSQKEFEEYTAYLLSDPEYLPQLEEAEEGEEVVVLTTTYGDITIRLFPEEAPKAVENFKTLVKNGSYDGVSFHRIINDFMIQTGNYGGGSIWGEAFPDELSPNLMHFRGAVAMANSGPNTNGSQFYIVQKPELYEDYFEYLEEAAKDIEEGSLASNNETGTLIKTKYTDEVKELYKELGGTPDLDYGYTVFGQVISGMDVVDTIAAVETDENDAPVTEVVITKAEVVTYAQQAD